MGEQTLEFELLTCINMLNKKKKKKKKLLTRFQSHHFDIKHNNDTTVARHFDRCPTPNLGKFEGMEISILSFFPPATKLSCKPGSPGQRRETLDPQII